MLDWIYHFTCALLLLVLLLLPCCKYQDLNRLETNMLLIQRNYASTNYKIDTLSAKIEALEKKILQNKVEIASHKIKRKIEE